MTGGEPLPGDASRLVGFVAAEDEPGAVAREPLRPIFAIVEVDRELGAAQARRDTESRRNFLAREPAAERGGELIVLRPGARGIGVITGQGKGDRGRAPFAVLPKRDERRAVLVGGERARGGAGLQVREVVAID